MTMQISIYFLCFIVSDMDRGGGSEGGGTMGEGRWRREDGDGGRGGGGEDGDGGRGGGREDGDGEGKRYRQTEGKSLGRTFTRGGREG